MRTDWLDISYKMIFHYISKSGTNFDRICRVETERNLSYLSFVNKSLSLLKVFMEIFFDEFKLRIFITPKKVEAAPYETHYPSLYYRSLIN